MTFQPIRGAISKVVSDALVAAGVPFDHQVWDNVQETPPADPTGTYASTAISFISPTVQTIGCEGMDAVRGTCNVLILTPKRQGAKPAEDIALEVVKAWCGINGHRDSALDPYRIRTYGHRGPTMLAPDQGPHAIWSVSCTFTGSVP